MADSKTSPTYSFAEQFAANLSKATGGRLTVQVYPSSELGAASAEITGVQAGTIAFLATPDLDSVVPQVDLAILPYLFSSMNQAQTILNSSQMHSVLWSQFTKYNLDVIGTWPIGPLGIMTKVPNANTLASLNGQKIRVLAPLVMSPLLKAWGINPTPVDPTQVLPSLSTGLIDGVFDPPTPITDQGWAVYGKSYLETNAVFNVDPLVMSSKIMNTLPAADQKAIQSAFEATVGHADAVIGQESQAAVNKMKSMGIGIYTPNPAPFKQAAAAAESSWDKTFGASLIAKVRAVVKQEGGA